MIIIPNHLARVPFNDRQYAATKAILFVEDKMQKGQHLKRYSYACALIRFFTGNKEAITAKDLHYTLVLSFDDKREMPSKNRYLSVLDTFIQSRDNTGQLPLCDHHVRDFFSELDYRERQGRKIQSQVQAVSRARQKAQIKAQQQYQNRLAQAEIELAFITPSEFKSWYNRFNRDGIEEYDLIELLVNWTKRFKNLNLRKTLDFAPLQSALLDFNEDIDTRSYGEQLRDNYTIPNKLIGKKGVDNE